MWGFLFVCLFVFDVGFFLITHFINRTTFCKPDFKVSAECSVAFRLAGVRQVTPL